MRLHRDAKIDLIRGVPLFSRCSRRDLAEISSLADEIDIPAGKELIREDERGREFFVLLEGTVEVSKDGREVTTLGPGDFVGEIALVSRIPRIATVRAIEPVRALVIGERNFRSLLERSPDIQLKVLEALAARIVETSGAPTL